MTLDFPNISIWVFCFAGLILHVLWIGWIDARHMIIPDVANLSLAVSGLVWTIASRQSVPWQMLQMLCTGILFWLIRWLYAKFRGKVGLGIGDVKFAAAATAWIGVLAVPWLVLVASISALATLVVFQLSGHDIDVRSRIPFGPHLCFGLLATWLALFYGYL